jgi:DNA-binding SARP family transcriptional activator
MRFHALGGLTISDNGDEVSVAGTRQRRLVAMLLIHRNAVVSVDRLADAVFAGAPTPAASTTLRSYVARLRRVVDGDGSGPTFLLTKPPGYVLRVPDDAFDVGRFESMLGEGRARLARDDAVGASAVLRGALELWRGDAYAEFADEDWARPEAQRLGELRLVAHERLIDAELACGRAAELIPEIEALVSEHPLRDAFRAQLMIALYRSGRQVDALRVVREYRRVLVEELGLDPSPALSELERRVLAHDVTLTSPSLLGCRCAAIASASASAPVATGRCTPPACPGSSASSRSASSARRSPTARSSCARSRPPPIGWRRCVTPPSSPSTTTGASRAPRTW